MIKNRNNKTGSMLCNFLWHRFSFHAVEWSSESPSTALICPEFEPCPHRFYFADWMRFFINCPHFLQVFLFSFIPCLQKMDNVLSSRWKVARHLNPTLKCFLLSCFIIYYYFFLPKHLRLDVTQFACQCKQRANWTGQPSVVIHLHQRIKGRHWSAITCFAILSLSGCCVLLISRLRRGLQASLLVTWLTSEVHLEQILRSKPKYYG